MASFVESSFDKKPFDLRDRDLLHAPRGDVRTIEVRGPEGAYSLARTDAGEWAFTKPLATRAGRWKVDGLLGTLENLRMESVADEIVPGAGHLFEEPGTFAAMTALARDWFVRHLAD